MKHAHTSLHPTGLALVMVAGLLGCPGSQAPPPVTSINQQLDTTLGPGDVFDVSVFGEKELSGRFRVSTDGTVDYPLVGSVKLAGLRPPQAAALIQSKLADGFLKNPHVSIFVESYNSKKISVFGQVRKPGTFNYVNNMSIIEAITLAGGFTPLASKNSIRVTRKEDNGKATKFTLPVMDIGEGRAANYLLKPGDVVFVPERIF